MFECVDSCSLDRIDVLCFMYSHFARKNISKIIKRTLTNFRYCFF